MEDDNNPLDELTADDISLLLGALVLKDRTATAAQGDHISHVKSILERAFERVQARGD